MGDIYVVSGFSGAGKSSVCKDAEEILEKYKGNPPIREDYDSIKEYKGYYTKMSTGDVKRWFWRKSR